MSHLTKPISLAFGALVLLLVGHSLSAADLNGNWNFSFDYGEGVYPLTISLEVEGEKVRGAHEKEPFEGTFRDGKLSISGKHYVYELGYASTLTISGVLDGDQIKGRGPSISVWYLESRATPTTSASRSSSGPT